MVGHVNMMDDVLIANLPPELLRSALRNLISIPSNQKLFTSMMRSKLEATPAPPVTEQAAYLAHARCIFAAKLSQDALLLLTKFITANSDIASPEVVSGDIVQAMQSVKESTTTKEPKLKSLLSDLLSGISSHPQQATLARARRQVEDTLSLFFGTPLSAPPQSRDLKFAESSAIEISAIGNAQVPRLFNGLWQLASPAWGSASAASQTSALEHLAEKGLTAADMADHYGDAELVYGDFRASLSEAAQSRIYAASKWCVFKPPTEPVTHGYVLSAVKERCRRLRGTVQLLQFHWYDYSNEDYLEILLHLVNIASAQPELVTAIGLCNFDSEHTIKVCEYLTEKTGKPGVVSNQVQFSLLDSRPLKRMLQVCEKYNLKLLTYGSYAGGLISDKWIRGPPEPYADNITPSQRKYLDTLSTWGSWSEFQELLATLQDIATKNGVSIANVAVKWLLQYNAVGAVIVGTRLGVSEHADDNLRVFDWHLTIKDVMKINKIALGPNGEKTDQVFDKLGDCGNEYRH